MLASTYLVGNGLLHRVDPRAKSILLVASTVLSLLPLDLSVVVALAVTILAVALLSLGVREAFRPVRATLPLLLLLCLLNPPFYSQGKVLLAAGSLRLVTDYGLRETIRLICRLLALTVAFYAYFRSTETSILLQTGRWFGLPWSACLVVGVAVRLVPSIAALYLGVLDAHSLRRPASGARRRGPAAELRRLLPAVTAVLVHSVRSIPVLSMALETRGVGRRNPRSSTVTLGGPGRMLLHLVVGLAVLALPLLVSLVV